MGNHELAIWGHSDSRSCSNVGVRKGTGSIRQPTDHHSGLEFPFRFAPRAGWWETRRDFDLPLTARNERRGAGGAQSASVGWRRPFPRRFEPSWIIRAS